MIYRIYDNLHLGVLQIYEISFYRGNKEYQIPCQLIISYQIIPPYLFVILN